MNKIFTIGQAPLKKVKEIALACRGKSVLKFKSINDMRYRPEDRPDIIIVDKNQSSEKSFREFQMSFKDVPKIVFSDSYSFKGFSPWIKYPQTYALQNPSTRELEFIIRRALEVKGILNENLSLRDRLVAVTHELEFFDEVSKTLTSTHETSVSSLHYRDTQPRPGPNC